MSIRLQGLPEMLELWDELVAACASAGVVIDVADYGGFRTAADTAEIETFKQQDYAAYAAVERAAGRTPVAITGPWEDGSNRPIAPYGQSWHDYGAARDVAILSKPANMSGLAAVALVDNMAESLGLDTGASYGDPLHVQLPISLEDARGEWAAYVAAGGGSSSSAAIAWLLLAAGIGVVVVVKHAKGLSTWR